MKENKKRHLFSGIIYIAAFIIWTILILNIDVQSVGQNGTNIGFSTFNHWFHHLTGVHMTIYVITDWLGLVPVFICFLFGGLGLFQWIKRKNLFQVDHDIILLGIYYVIVILGYLIFEIIPINYRPILIDGFLEASYPSSTTLLVLSVMPTLVFQSERRLKNAAAKKSIRILAILFSVFMVMGRLYAGVHWFTDIVGAVLLSTGLFEIYKTVVLLYCKEKN